jgi:histidinol-phosphate aminotransferase
MHDSVPMLVISAQVPTPWLERPARGYLHHLRNSTDAAACVSKASFRVKDAAQIPSVLHEAHNLASTGRKGPVHVEISLDHLLSVCTESEAQHAVACPAANDMLSDAARQALREVSEKLSSCKRPVFVVGGGAVEASPLLVPLAEELGALVISTAAGKGIVDERHALSLGCRLHMPPVADLIHKSDVMVLFGTQLSPTDWWSDPMDAEIALPDSPETCIVHVDLDPESLEGSKRVMNHLSVQADCSLACSYLLEELRQQRLKGPPRPETWSGASSVTVSETLITADSVEVLSSTLGQSKENLVAIKSDLESLRAALPAGCFASFDMCCPGYAALSHFRSYAPRTFAHPVGFGELGYALPVAIGAAEANPSSPVVAVTGDGGFQFTLPELAVACERNLPLLLIVWNDRSYGEIRRQLPDDFATSLPLPEFSRICEAYGIPHIRSRSAAEFRAALANPKVQDVFNLRGGPIMIEVDRTVPRYDTVEAASVDDKSDAGGLATGHAHGANPGLSLIEPYAYSASLADAVAKLGFERIIKLSSNENHYAPFPSVIEAATKELTFSNRYPDHELVSLKENMAKRLQRTSRCTREIEASNICFMQGAEVGAMLIATSFLSPGDECILTPGYYVHKQASLLNQGTITTVPLKNYRIDLQAVADAVTSSTKLIWLTNPHSPLGTLFDVAQLRPVLDALEVKTGGRGRLVLDEVYSDFSTQDDLPDTMRMIVDDELPIISLRSLSKSAGMAGFRIGFIVASKAVIRSLDTASNPFTNSRPALAGANALFEPEGTAAWDHSTRTIINDREELQDWLEQLPGVELSSGRSGTNFVIFETPGVLSQVLAEKLLVRHGILVRPGASWGFPHHTRVSIGTTEEMKTFRDALTDVLSGDLTAKGQAVDGEVGSSTFFAAF